MCCGLEGAIMVDSSSQPRNPGKLRRWWSQWLGAGDRPDCCSACIQEDVQEAAEPRRPGNLAGKWPDSASLLMRRMSALNVNPTGVDRALVEDMKQRCSLCTGKERCEHELSTHTGNGAWRTYCVNSEALQGLQARRDEKADRRQ